MNEPSLRVGPSARAEGRGKDRLSVGACTISRQHVVSRGARVSTTAAEIIATFVRTSTSACGVPSKAICLLVFVEDGVQLLGNPNESSPLAHLF